MTLDELSRDISGCTRCTLYKNRTKSIAGWFPETSKSLLFLLDSPSLHDEITDSPLCDELGVKFSKTISDIFGLDRTEYCISHCVKCVSIDGNKHKKPPPRDSMFWCAKYVYAQLEIVNPKLIITIGYPAFYELIKRKALDFSDMKKEEYGSYTGKLYLAQSILHPNIVWPTIPVYDIYRWMDPPIFEKTLRHLRYAKEIYDNINRGKSVQHLFESI